MLNIHINGKNFLEFDLNGVRAFYMVYREGLDYWIVDFLDGDSVRMNCYRSAREAFKAGYRFLRSNR